MDARILELQEMLTYKRPASSQTELDFINKYIIPLGNLYKSWVDGFGNIYVEVGTSEVLWSSHTDTVHWDDGMQHIVRDEQYFRLPKRARKGQKKSSCLGADCTTGVWIMRQMILAGVPGLYIFHREEERGAIGSKYISKNHKSLLAKYKYAIAFDRKGIDSVITHQMNRRCCSEAFSKSFSAAIIDIGHAYKSDDLGSFTDTAFYVDDIGECSNISVGYYSQHTSSEVQDHVHALALCNVMCSFDESILVHERKPGEEDPDDWIFDRYSTNYRSFSKPSMLQSLVQQYPYTTASILEHYGIDAVKFAECANAKAVGKPLPLPKMLPVVGVPHKIIYEEGEDDDAQSACG